MSRQILSTVLAVVAFAGLRAGSAAAQAPIPTPRKPILIVEGTAVGFAGPSVPLVEELVVHNDGLVTLETTAASETCRSLRRFVPAATVEKLRADLLAAGAFEQADFIPGQTADLPFTTVTLFRGLPGTRFDLSSSFTYERVNQLPAPVAAVRDRIRNFVTATFADFAKNGCAFPF
jgi:hypothetical protein